MSDIAQIREPDIPNHVAGFGNIGADFYAKVGGWSADTDCRILYALARTNPVEGCIVELGSYEGRSTISLARGSKSGPGDKVFAVDHHLGDGYAGEGGTWDTFNQNIRTYEVDDVVVPMHMSSIDAAKQWDKGRTIRLIFIDAAHLYEDVKSDFESWIPFMVPGGVVAFHDYPLFEYVQAYVDLIKDDYFVHYDNVPQLFWGQLKGDEE